MKTTLVQISHYGWTVKLRRALPPAQPASHRARRRQGQALRVPSAALTTAARGGAGQAWAGTEGWPPGRTEGWNKLTKLNAFVPFSYNIVIIAFARHHVFDLRHHSFPLIERERLKILDGLSKGI